MTTIDLFAGPGGWDEALVALAVADVVGIELDEAACATAEAAGHKRLRADVADWLPELFGSVTGLVASPPCPSFSTAGKGLGKLDAPHVLAHIESVRRAGRWLAYGAQWHDPRSALVLEPLRYALTLRPDWIALEQVPPVLPIWQAMADVLREHGYHVETGWLTAEQYGVPQTRKRAILTARRCWRSGPRASCVSWACSNALLPAPTHRKYRKGVAQHEGDPALLPWVSMADALGTLSGAEVMRSNYGSNGDPAARGERAANQPAPTVTGRIDRNKWVRFGNQEHSAVRSVKEPAATLRFSERMTACDWIFDRPAPTIVGTRRSSEGMLVGRQLGLDDVRRDTGGHAGAVGLTKDQLPAVRVSVQEAAVLQSFRPDYPWQGSRTAQYQQVGNAIPPLLAQAVLRPLIG